MNKRLLNILLVENDNEDFLPTSSLLAEIKTFDCAIHRTTTYLAAKEAIAKYAFDVCLIDYHLDERNGLELLHEVIAEGFRAPIILLTGQDDRTIYSEAMSAGAADCLVKEDIKPVVFERAIRYALDCNAAEITRRQMAELQSAILDALPTNTCLIDKAGKILEVNKEWKQYALKNGYQGIDFAVGSNYLEICDKATGNQSENAKNIAKVCRSILSGQSSYYEMEYPCYSPTEKNWFKLMIAPLQRENESGAIIMHVNITERKQSESANHQSEEKYRSILETIEDGYFELDLSGRLIFFNEALCRLLGYGKDELMNLSYREYCDKKTAKMLYDIFNKVFKTRQSRINSYWEIIRKNGERRIHESSVHLIYNDANEPIGFRGLVRDITERKQVEKNLQESELRYRQLFESNPNAIWICDVETLQFLAVNEEAIRLFGYSREEFQTITTKDLRPAEDLSLFLEYVAHAEADVEKFHSIRLQKKDGTIIEAEITRQAIKFAGKRAIITLIIDITERQRAEKELRESQQMLKLVIDTLPQAIWWKDGQGVYRGANRYIANVAGFDSPEKMLGLTDYDMPWTEAEVETYRKVDRRVMQSGIAELDMIETQLQFNGREAVVVTNKVPFRNEDGEIVGVLGTFADITEHKRADNALRESEYKLRTLLKTMREGLLQVDKKDRIIFINDCFCEMVGYSSAELMGIKWTRLLFDSGGLHIVKQANRRREAGISDSYELCLKKKSGEKLWVIVGGAPTADLEGVITGSMGVFTDITTRKQIEQQLLHDAFHDGLTGLANRTLFSNHLQMTIERTKRKPEELFAVLFLDFDRFKVINDSLGHAEGDKLLKQIARRLESSMRSGDLVARLGGDEFTILLTTLGDSSVALRVAERIQKNLQTPFNVGGSDIFISASIGIALSTTGHDRAEDMLRDADIAMYHAKAKGKAQHQVFDRAMHEHASKQLRLETEMRQALERKEFVLHYQPIYHLETETLIGFESLVRWKHATRGMIPPFEFISAAEENNLILPLGKWILYESCRQLRSWQENNPAAAHFKISVNLSSKQFLQADLTEQVSAAIETTGIDPNCLKLEITESHIMENTEMAIRTLENLRSLGVELSLDDFGTGYSSLSYLHRLPVSYLKIDRSFVIRMIESEENAEIVHTIIKLGQNLKMKVIAEGIETSEQLAQLRKLNCEFGQGYFLARPMEAEALESLLEEVYCQEKFMVGAK